MIEVLVYAADGTTAITSATHAMTACSFMDELEDCGGGSLTVPLDSSVVAHLAYRRVVKVRVDGTIRAAFIIEKKSYTTVGEGGAAERAVTVSGRGLLAWLADSAVWQEFPGAYTAGTRMFSWGSASGDWLNESEWGYPSRVKQRGGADQSSPSNPWRDYPRWWPNENAWWVWDRPNANVSAPVGSVYFRVPFTIAGGSHFFRLYCTGDNWLEAQLDGEPLIRNREIDGWKNTYEIDIEITAGSTETHMLAFRVENRTAAANPAGLLVTLYEYSDEARDPGTATVVVQSGANPSGAGNSWRCLSYPAVEPGWTAGQVLIKLLAESDDRGVTTAGYITAGFTGLADSNGDLWTDRQNWNFPVGSSMLDVVNAMRDQGIDTAVNPDNLTLYAYQSKGDDLAETVTIHAAAHVTGATQEEEAPQANSLMVATSEGYAYSDDVASQSSYGKIEGFLDVASLEPTERGPVVLATLAKAAIPVEAVTATFVPDASNMPWTEYATGDRVSVADENGGVTARIVMSIAVEVDEAANALYSLEFDAVSRDEIDRLDRIIKSAGLGRRTLGGTVSSSTGGGGGGYGDSDYSDGGYDSGYRTASISQGEELDPWVPPNDVSNDDTGIGWSVGNVDGAVALNPSDYFGVEDVEVALLSSEPPSASGGWASLNTYELTSGTATGYARAAWPATAIAAGSYDAGSINRASTADVTFDPNTGAAAWPTVTHVALVSDVDGKVFSVIPLSTPLVIGPNEAASIPSGSLVVAHACPVAT